MYGYPWGPPPMFFGGGNPNQNNNDLGRQIEMAVWKVLQRASDKKENKKKKRETPMLTFAQAWAITFASAIPVAIFQGYMLGLMRTALTTAINGSPQ